MIVVTPLHELERVLARWRPSHVISLASPGADAVSLPSDVEVLRLSFHDISEPREGLAMASGTDVDRLLAFGRGWSGDRPLLVHCWAGVSRSPAAAYVIACSRSAAGDEQRLANALRRAAPFATPNRHLVTVADTRLGRGGAMAQAVTRMGRGAEVGLGRMFILA